MNIVLILLQSYLPEFIKKKKLAQLFAITSIALECEAPSTQGLNFEERLHKYALFTKEQIEKYLASSSNVENLKEKLFLEAYRLGQQLRQDFGIATGREVMLMMKIIYRALGIEFHNNSENEIIINRCFFSQYYSPDICQVIASLDEGLAAGLSDGGNLSFYQRITEGNNCCRANFVFKGVSK